MWKIFLPFLFLYVLLKGQIWKYVYTDVFAENDFRITVFGTFAVAMTTFWSLSLLMMYPDLTGKPKWLVQYKVQPGTNSPVDKSKLLRAVRQALSNDVLITLPFLVLVYPLQKALGCATRPEDIPGYFWFLVQIAGMIASDEATFYYTHRLFHWGPLYRRFHKVHHEWTAPVGVVAYYAHPMEHVFCNIPTLFLGALLTRAHILTFWIWIIMANYVTVFHHSGYRIPHAPDPLYHENHHIRFNGNYGSGILDRFHGTDIGIAPRKTAKLNKE